MTTDAADDGYANHPVNGTVPATEEDNHRQELGPRMVPGESPVTGDDESRMKHVAPTPNTFDGEWHDGPCGHVLALERHVTEKLEPRIGTLHDDLATAQAKAERAESRRHSAHREMQRARAETKRKEEHLARVLVERNEARDALAELSAAAGDL